jgi:Uma2 family endonuclease
MPAQMQKTMTLEEFLALPENGKRRWLIDGVVREWPSEGSDLEPPMTVRNRFHGRITATTCTELEIWMRTRPEPRGLVVGGEVGFIFSRDPLSVVGIDVAIVPHEVASREAEGTTLFDGLPFLAVEILSPSDTLEGIAEKRGHYRRAGIPLVWLIDPSDQTVTIYQAGARPRMVAAGDELACEPHLPGFRIPVARLFA